MSNLDFSEAWLKDWPPALAGELSFESSNFTRVQLKKSNSIYQKLTQLREDNLHLKEAIESDNKEFSDLKQSYHHIEDQLKSILDEHRCLENEKDEEIARLETELHRSQACQRRSEISLKNQLEVKQDLEAQLERLETERTSLKEQLENYQIDLRLEKSRSKQAESTQIDRLAQEIDDWRQKFDLLKRDKTDVENSLRRIKLQYNQLDSSHQSELDLMRDLNRHELNRSNGVRLKLEEENIRLKSRLEEEQQKRGKFEVENQKLDDDLTETRKQLEIVISDKRNLEVASNKLEASNRRLKVLDGKVELLESNMDELLHHRSSNERKLEDYRMQIQELKENLKTQKKAYADLQDDNETKLSKLRFQLNLKHHSRQLVLKRIKSELQRSLEELKALKCRMTTHTQYVDQV